MLGRRYCAVSRAALAITPLVPSEQDIIFEPRPEDLARLVFDVALDRVIVRTLAQDGVSDRQRSLNSAAVGAPRLVREVHLDRCRQEVLLGVREDPHFGKKRRRRILIDTSSHARPSSTPHTPRRVRSDTIVKKPDQRLAVLQPWHREHHLKRRLRRQSVLVRTHRDERFVNVDH